MRKNTNAKDGDNVSQRALPANGLIPQDCVFESAADGGEVRFSELIMV
jgi:hypothetical protein